MAFTAKLCIIEADPLTAVIAAAPAVAAAAVCIA